MSTLDAPSHETTCVRRECTNTPLQALLLLNDRQYVEASQALAIRAMRAEVDSTSARAGFMYRLCTSRHASKATIDELVRLYEDQLAKYQLDDTAARQLAATRFEIPSDESFDTRQLAAWTIVANLILNLDEVVTKN